MNWHFAPSAQIQNKRNHVQDHALRCFDELLEERYDPAAAAKTADRHHAILLAIKASDPRGARIALHSHFDGLRNRIGGRDFKID